MKSTEEIKKDIEKAILIQMTTTFERRTLMAAIDAISTDDWMEKNK